jgi:hypothetical protein
LIGLICHFGYFREVFVSCASMESEKRGPGRMGKLACFRTGGGLVLEIRCF